MRKWPYPTAKKHAAPWSYETKVADYLDIEPKPKGKRAAR